MASTSKAVIQGLSEVLADTYLLYLKTQNFHWNVEGPHFYSLHKMYEEQYEQLAQATDLLAERIRALKAKAPGSFAEFLKLASLKEARSNVDYKAQIKQLTADHEKIARSINDLIEVAQEAGDEVTVDMLIARKTEHDKTAWMLRSTQK